MRAPLFLMLVATACQDYGVNPTIETSAEPTSTFAQLAPESVERKTPSLRPITRAPDSVSTVRPQGELGSPAGHGRRVQAEAAGRCKKRSPLYTA